MGVKWEEKSKVEERIGEGRNEGEEEGGREKMGEGLIETKAWRAFGGRKKRGTGGSFV